MRYMMAAGRGLCLTAAGAALVAVIVSGASALSYGQSDGALVAAFFGALVALAGSLWVCSRFFGASALIQAQGKSHAAARPAWYTGPARVAPAPSAGPPPRMPRPPQWGPYRREIQIPTPGEVEAPASPALDDTQRVQVSVAPGAAPEPANVASDTRPMKAVRPMKPVRPVLEDAADTRRVQATPSAPRPVTPPDSLPESPESPEPPEPPERSSQPPL